MDKPFEFFDEDDMIFYHILSKLYDDFNTEQTNRVEDLEEIFGEGISDYVFRLKEKGFVTFVKTRVENLTFHFLDINDKGIEALKALYDPEVVKRKKLEQKQERQQKEREIKLTETSHKWTKIGVITAIIISSLSLIVSILRP